MSGVRAPRFAGVTGGVGTSTLATALHGVDTGRYAGGPVDVLVCGVGSLATAARLGGPVLAVVADRAPRLDRLAAGFGAVVTVPEIAAWRELEVPDVAGLLGVAPERRSAGMRPYVEALLEITAALLRSGALAGPARPVRPSFSPAVMARGVPIPVRAVEIGRPRPVVLTAALHRTRPTEPPAAGDAPGPVATESARTAVARIAAAPLVPTSAIPGPAGPATAVAAPVEPAPVVPATAVPAPVGHATGVPAPVDPPPVDPSAIVPTPVDPRPVSPRPVGPAPAVPAPAVTGAPDPAGRAGAVRPLWRGLQAVERVPVLLTSPVPAPVPVSRTVLVAPEPVGGRPLRLRAELDDDAVESLRIG